MTIELKKHARDMSPAEYDKTLRDIRRRADQLMERRPAAPTPPRSAPVEAPIPAVPGSTSSTATPPPSSAPRVVPTNLRAMTPEQYDAAKRQMLADARKSEQNRAEQARTGRTITTVISTAAGR